MKNCCTPTFWEFFKMMRKSVLYTNKPVIKCKKHNKNIFLSKQDYKKVRHISIFYRPVFSLFGCTFLFYFFGGLKTLPIAVVGTVLLVIYLSINYSFYKKTCKNKKYYHISNSLKYDKYQMSDSKINVK